MNRELFVMLILYLGTAGWKSSPEKFTVLSLSVFFLKKKKKELALCNQNTTAVWLCDSFDVEYKMVKSEYTAEG